LATMGVEVVSTEQYLGGLCIVPIYYYLVEREYYHFFLIVMLSLSVLIEGNSISITLSKYLLVAK
jgi:hypothetical protein